MTVALATLTLAACGGSDRPSNAPSPTPPSRKDARVMSFDGVPIVYTVAGQGAGAVVLVHGWSGDRSYWEQQIADLGRDYRVVALDLAGHGDSGRERSEWTIESLARDVEAVVDDLHLDSVILVGHSMGGPVALEAARRMPGRVVGVIGVDTLHDVEHRIPEEQAARLLQEFERDFAGTCARYARSLLSPDPPSELLDEVTLDMCSASPAIALRLLRALWRLDQAAALEAARVPVRCVNSAASLPTNVEANRRHAPEFEAYIMEGVGHFPMLERPGEFNRLLRQALEDLTSPHTI